MVVATLPTSNVQALRFGFSVWFPGFFTCLVQATPAESGQSEFLCGHGRRSRCPPHGTLTVRTPGPPDTRQELRSIPGSKTRVKAPDSDVRSIGHSLPVELGLIRRTIVDDDEALEGKGARRLWNHSVTRPGAEGVEPP